MKFATFWAEAERVGVLSADGAVIYPLEALDIDCSTMLELIESYESLSLKIAERLQSVPMAHGIPAKQVKYMAPIPHPRHDIICVGHNYTEHVRESLRFAGKEFKLPQYPMFFSKHVTRAVGHEGTISAHADITRQLDYEVELAVVIGKTCDHVSPQDVWTHIFGYSIANDVSARELQRRHGQFFFGKSLDDFFPMGPVIVTPDDLPEPLHLQVTSRVNGEPRQNGNTSDFIFDIGRLVCELSAGITLEPGDILITGTPSGVGMGFNPPKFMKAGDIVECEIEGIGILRNKVV